MTTATTKHCPDALDLDKLVRVLGLMGSNHDGEALAAARMAERLRRAAGVSWDEIVGADQYRDGYADGYAAGLKRGRQTRRRPVSWRELVEQIVDRYSCSLTEFEHAARPNMRRMPVRPQHRYHEG